MARAPKPIKRLPITDKTLGQTEAVRARLYRDAAWMRRMRMRYAMRIRRWVDADRSRIDVVARRWLAIGLLKGNPDVPADRRGVRYSLLRHWFRADVPDTSGCAWHRWYHENDWETYTWLPRRKVGDAVERVAKRGAR